MNCREFIDFITRYIEGELSTLERTRFEAHLDVCDECVDYLQSYKTTIAVEAHAFEFREQDLADVPETLIQAVLASTSHR